MHNFLESEKRLQVCMDQTKATLDAIAHERARLMQGHMDHLPEEQKEEIAAQVKAATQYHPKTMMNAITDVVKQDITATVKSLGIKDGKRCWDAIKGQVEENAAPQKPQEPALDPNNVNIPA